MFEKEGNSMKKWIALLLALLQLASFAACSAPEEAEPVEPVEPVVEEVIEEEPVEEPVEKEPEEIEEVEEEPVEMVLQNQLTGEPCTEEEVLRRPIAIMINNLNEDVQEVQCGLSEADIILETYVEGGITRLLAVFKDASEVGQIGTIRSARIDYAKIANAYDLLYFHVGEDKKYCKPYRQSVGMDDIDLGVNNLGFREKNGLASEHTYYAKGDALLAGAEKLNKRMETTMVTPWFHFCEEGANQPPAGGEACSVLKVKFSGNNSDAFHYNEETGLYERWTYGEVREDYKTDAVTAVKNVFVFGTTVGLKKDKKHVEISLDGGDGYYASEGQIIPIRWSTDDNGRFVVTTADGEDLTVNIGSSYICLNQDQYEPTWE